MHLRTFLRFDVLAFLACLVFFVLWPDFDLAISSRFYDQETKTFYLKNHLLFKSIYNVSDTIGLIAVLLIPTLLLASYIRKFVYLSKVRIILWFLLACLLVGPGIVVNLLLKDNWDRPRPRQTIEFGGSKTYEPPFSPTFNCDKCHSFVSGHASVGFYFFSFVLLLKNRRYIWLPVIAGAVIGAGRIVQGGHFLSDVIFSGFVVWFCSLLLYKMFVKFSTTPVAFPVTHPSRDEQ